MCQERRGNITGGQDSCNLKIKATPSDHGPWTCMLTLSDDYEAVTTYLDLEVAVRPSMSISYDTGGQTVVVGGQGHGNNTTTVHSVQVVEGEDKNFTCTAERGFPRPVFYWTLVNMPAELQRQNKVKYLLA